MIESRLGPKAGTFFYSDNRDFDSSMWFESAECVRVHQNDSFTDTFLSRTSLRQQVATYLYGSLWRIHQPIRSKQRVILRVQIWQNSFSITRISQVKSKHASKGRFSEPKLFSPWKSKRMIHFKDSFKNSNSVNKRLKCGITDFVSQVKMMLNVGEISVLLCICL